VLFVWFVAFCLASPILIKPKENLVYLELPNGLELCIIKYTSSLGTIYTNSLMILLPAIVMIYLYIKLFGGLTTRFNNNLKLKNDQNYQVDSNLSSNDRGTSSAEISDSNTDKDNYVLESPGNSSNTDTRSETVSRYHLKNSDGSFVKGVIKSKMERNAQKSNRAARTLGLLIACYSILCLPYFIVSIISVLFGESFSHLFLVPALMYQTNSAVNPIIYAIHNKDFRIAFKRMGVPFQVSV